MRILEKDINAIREKADIVDIIGNYLPLVKKGRNYACLCPFHDDHSPSMSISQDKQIYKCFVCNAGGNVFTFVMEYEKVSFVEAVKKVADLIGYHLEYEIKDDYQENPYISQSHKLLQETVLYLSYSLNSKANEKYKNYLLDRKINEKLIEQFNIGFDDGKLSDFLLKKGYKSDELVGNNLSFNHHEQLKDVFNQRICFPIHDAYGNPIAFTARTLEKNAPKYINTFETKLYKKGEIVYNYHRAKNAARKQGIVYLVEGVIDVIAFNQAGLSNVVATLGTACTTAQIDLLKKLAKHIVICYDGDEAGQNAIYKTGSMLHHEKLIVSVMRNYTTKDPADIINQEGIDTFKQMVEKPYIWLEFVMEYLQKKYNLQNYTDKKAYVLQVMKQINQCYDEFDKDNFIDLLEKQTGMKVTKLKDESPKKKQIIKTNAPTINNTIDAKGLAEDIILNQLLKSRSAADQFMQELGFLPNSLKQKLAMSIIDKYRNCDKIQLSEFIDHVESEQEKNLLINLVTSINHGESYDQKLLHGAIKRIKQWMFQEKVFQLEKEIHREQNPNKLAQLLKLYNKNLLELRRYLDEQ